jgi:small-conductance mechanosensitive channel
MPILTNPQHELFARLLFKGTRCGAAYVLSGYKANRGNASDLKSQEYIQRRIAELQSMAAQAAAVDQSYVLCTLITVIERSLQQRQALDAEGKPAGLFNYNPVPAVRAAELLGKYQQMFTDKIAVTRKITSPDDLTDEEAIAMAQVLKEREKIDLGVYLGVCCRE